MLLQRDCIFLKYSGNPTWRDIKGEKHENFYSIKFESGNADALVASFEWIDPIKVRDKIVTTQWKQITFIVYPEKNALCIFGGSESQITYIITRLSALFEISLNKIKLFEQFKSTILNFSNPFIFKLTSVDIFKEKIGGSDNTIHNVSVDEIKNREMEEFLTSSQVLSLILVYLEKNIFFSIDLYSVVSFFDTYEVEQIFNVCKRIVKVIV